MRAAAVIAMIVAMALAPAAAAQLAKGGKKPLTAAQAQALFGIDMEGYSPTLKFNWRECIDPKGETLYETPAGVQHGRLNVGPDGTACFAYEDDGYAAKSCYSVSRNGAGFLFNGAFGEVFVTTRVVSGVKSCKPNADLIG